MADYLPTCQKIIARAGNVVYTADGNVWVNYLLRGPVVDPYSSASIQSARRCHDILYTSLAELGSDEIIISGFLAPVDVRRRMARMVEGIPNFTPEAYPAWVDMMQEYRFQVASGYLAERERIYILCVRVPDVSVSVATRVSARLTGHNPFSGVDTTPVGQFNEKVAAAIPGEMAGVPAPGVVLDWARRRACTRGLTLPEMPHTDVQVMSPNGVFEDIRINPVPDSHATVTTFGKDYARTLRGAEGLSPRAARKKQRGLETSAARGLAAYFTSLRKGAVMSVSNLSKRTAASPDGPVSYQAIAAVGQYATTPDYSMNTLTSTVDMAIGLDADFTIRLTPAPHLADNEHINTVLRTIGLEDASNSHSELDSAQYADQARELLAFTRARDAEKAPTPLKVTTLFAFGAPTLDQLTDRIRAVERIFSDNGYGLFRPVGGQEALWAAMMPCTPSTPVIRDLAGASTAHQLGAYIPIRRVSIGDGAGFPLGVCIENTLGTEVHIDLVNPTLRGNGSMAFTGAQGKGKSYAMKRIVGAMADLKALTVILDGQGEWATWASQLASHQTVDLAYPEVSIDPLKLMGTHTEEGLRTACDMLRTLLLPMCNVTTDSEEGAGLARFMTPEYIRGRSQLKTTRDLLEHIVTVSGENYAVRRVIPTLKQMLTDETMGAFIDPVRDGKVVSLPPLAIAARTIVFVTKGLRLPQPGKPAEKLTLPERYTLMANSAVALLTAWIFDQYRSVSAFVMDEASFYDGLDVLTPLIKTPDRTGRKFGTFVIVGSQTGEELSAPEYKLVRRRFCMGQDSIDNAREALAWAGFADTDGNVPRGLITELVTDTSPLDPNRGNLPAEGRAGECFFNDGTRKGKMKIYPELLTNRAKYANTTTDGFIRYGTSGTRELGD